MAKIVIAGAADCPYFAKAELLGDTLSENLPNFKLHKIVIQPDEWETWLSKTCGQRGWTHRKSPIVWRELVDRGGKGILIGGANDFQEYANGYYGIKSSFVSDDMRKIAKENLHTKNELDEEERQRQARSKPVRVCITQAAFGVAYNMINEISQGFAMGSETEVSLCLFDSNPLSEVLEGVQLESFDLAHGLLRKVTTTSDVYEAFTGCSFIVLLDDVEQDVEEPRDNWLKRNHEVFTGYAKVINEVAKKDVKVLIAGNGPSNFNAYMMTQEAPSISPANIMALSRMTERRAKSLLASRLQVNSACVTDVIIWGNPNGTIHADVKRAKVHKYEGAIVGPEWFSLAVPEMVHDDKWIETEFLQKLTERKDIVEGMLGHKASSSQASAVVGMMGHWSQGTPENQIFSAGVVSQGQYGVPEGMVFSFPVTIDSSGEFVIVDEIKITDELKGKIQEIVKELEKEKEAIYPPPSPPPAPTPEAVEEPAVPEERRSKTPPENPTSPVSGGRGTPQKSVDDLAETNDGQSEYTAGDAEQLAENPEEE